MIVNLDEMYGEDIPLLLPEGTPEYKIQELPDAVMPLVREYNELVEKAWGGIWIEATIRATALAASFLKNEGAGYHLIDDDKRLIRAECYKVLGTKMKITQPVKDDIAIIISRAEQYIDTL